MILRRLAVCIAVFAMLAAAPPAAATDADPLRVLFIGNSLTFYNDLPSLERQ